MPVQRILTPLPGRARLGRTPMLLVNSAEDTCSDLAQLQRC